MAEALYKQFKRTGAYTIFVDESELGREDTTTSAIHVLVGQSRFPSAPTNTLVAIRDTEELYNTFGLRDRFMERRGNFFIPQAEVLLSQGPLFMLNLREYTASDRMKLLSFTLDGVATGFDVEYASLFDKSTFWTFDKAKLADVSTTNTKPVFNIAAFTNKNSTVFYTKADMSGTEFANMTVGEYNARNPKRALRIFDESMPISMLFMDIHVFGTDLTTELTSGFNTELRAYIEIDAASNNALRIKGANATEIMSNLKMLKALKSAKYSNAYQGAIVDNIYSSMNDKLSLEHVFNADSRHHGLVLEFTTDYLEALESAPLADYGTLNVASTGILYSIPGVTPKPEHFVDGTSIRQNAILDMINTKSIKAGLTQWHKYDYKYILDSFKTYVETSTKWQLSKFAYDTKKIAYLHSVPFKKDFAANAKFLDVKSELDVAYIPVGGNDGTITYSMPGDIQGNVAMFPFAGGLTYDDGSGTVLLPANTIGAIAYGDKHLSSFKKPYTIINGPDNGSVAAPTYITAVESFSDDDLNSLEPFGWNVIVKRGGTAFEIRNDATAKNTNKSSLSMASNYELLLYFASKGNEILTRKIGRNNNDNTRATTEQELDAVAAKLQAEGVIERYDNRCDLNNNKADTRSRGLLIADSDLWTADGIKIAIHRLIVKLKTDANVSENQ